MAKLTKKQKAFEGKVDPNKHYGVDEAIGLVKSLATAKFDETVEIAINLGVDPRHADQMVRGVVNLPKGTGKDVRVAVFAKGDKAEEAKKAGAEVVGAEDLMEEIQGGRSDFDRVIATPDMMGVVGRLGKVLGPKGLMPNPKLGTVTPNVGQAVKDAKSGQVEFRVEKAGIIHAGIGKASFPEADLKANFDAFVDAIVKAKPSGAKGKYLKKVALSSSMGPGVRIDTAELAGRLKRSRTGKARVGSNPGPFFLRPAGRPLPKRRMRIAILCNGRTLAEWQRRAIDLIAGKHELFLLVCDDPPMPRKALRHGLYYLLNLLSVRNRLTRASPLPDRCHPDCRTGSTSRRNYEAPGRRFPTICSTGSRSGASTRFSSSGSTFSPFPMPIGSPHRSSPTTMAIRAAFGAARPVSTNCSRASASSARSSRSFRTGWIRAKCSPSPKAGWRITATAGR